MIDDAIVVVENVALHRDAGQGRLEAIRSALREITVPLIGSTITPIVVFLPLIAISGVTGVFFRALAITVGVSLLTSLALALTWTPTLSQYFIRGTTRGGDRTRSDSTDASLTDKEKLMAAEDAALTGRFRQVVEFYERWLRFALERPRWMAVFAAVLVIASTVCYQLLGTDLLPEMDEGGFIVDYLSPAGSSLQETNRMVSHIEQMLREIPEVESTSRRTGLELGLAAVTEANRGDIAVKLKNKRSRSGEEIISESARQGGARGAGPGSRIRAGAAGHDRRPVERAGAGADQTVLARRRRCWTNGRPRWATPFTTIKGVVDVRNGIENTISGPATGFPRRSHGRRARGLHSRRSCGRCQRGARRRTRSHARHRAGHPLHHSRTLSRIASHFACRDEQYSAEQRLRTHRYARLAGRHQGIAGTDRNPPRKPATGCRGHGAPGRPRPGQRQLPPCRKRSRVYIFRRRFAWCTAEPMKSSSSRFMT